MEQIIKSITNTNILQVIIIALISFIIWLCKANIKIIKDNIDKKKSTLKEIEEHISSITERLELNNQTIILLIYQYCWNEAKKWEEKNYIPLSSKLYFEKCWDTYIKLGDGNGDEPKKIIDNLKVID